jgi:putative transposase
MIDKDELLNSKDFYKSFKNAGDLTSLFKTMHKRPVVHILDAYLDNEKHDKTAAEIIGTDTEPKKIKTSF